MTLQQLALSPLSREFGHLIGRLAGGDDALSLAAALCSHLAERGGTSLDLDLLAGRPLNLLISEASGSIPQVDSQLLARYPEVISRGERRTPLVLDRRNRLYLWRFFRHEQEMAASLGQRIFATDPIPFSDADQKRLLDLLDASFPRSNQPDLQRLAALLALTRPFLLITGGPGTGKTTTLARILWIMQQLGAGGARIALAAPTGKAAGRLADSIRSAMTRLGEGRDRDAPPPEVSTIHRLLGADGTGRFRFGRDRKLPLDLVVVDEASMVDASLMAALTAALTDQTRLILLGDADQLASVEAGSVLGDLCEVLQGGLSPLMTAFATSMETALPEESAPGPRIPDARIDLRHTYRFSGEGSIGSLITLIREGDGDAVVSLAKETGVLSEEVEPERIADEIVGHFALLAGESDPDRAFAHFNAAITLCAHRRGSRGSETLNRMVRERLRKPGQAGDVLPGMPVMVVRNDYRQRLFNGDIGIALKGEGGEVQVFFPENGGGYRCLSTSLLPEWEPAYAMTIHKSQGSEFDRVTLLLPPEDSALMTRELIYTAVSRGKNAVRIVGKGDLLALAVGRRTERSSGLAGILLGDTQATLT